MIEIDLNDKMILMTGALGGIAESVVDRLIEAGAYMLLTDIVEPDRASEVLAQRGYAADRYTYQQMDVTEPDRVERVIGALFEEHPGVATVLGHAGGTGIQPFSETDAESFDQVVRYNFLSQTYLARSVLKHWTDRNIAGHMIFTTSWVGAVPWPLIAAYNASKAALNMFAKTLALEYAEHHIRFNLIAPGIVGVGKAKAIYDTTPEYKTVADRISPLGRLADPRALADAFVFLCSDLGRDLHGHVFNVDAGLSLTKLA